MSAKTKLATRNTVKREGLDIWAHGVVDGKDPEVDLVLVQGLNATPYHTWVGKRQVLEDAEPVSILSKLRGIRPRSDEDQDITAICFWPGELLPCHFTNARIATYSYRSDWHSRRARTSLRECGEQLLGHLDQFRREDTSHKRPIVFVGHSLGGLVIQQALVIANHGDEFEALRKSMAGAIFLGTPHQGSTVADFGDWAERVVHNDQPLLRTLKNGSEELFDLSRDFWNGYGTRLPVFCFFEHERSRYGVAEVKTVTQQSSTMVGKRMMYLNTDHSGLNKFWGEEDENFRIVLSEMERIMSFAADRRHEELRTSRPNVHWTVAHSTNTLFTGRSEVLNDLQNTIETHLNNKNKHEQGRVVITGMGGQGKSEICLHLANRMRQRFWAVFWVDVSDSGVATSGFLAIAKQLQKSAETIPEVLLVLASTEQAWLLILDNADDPHFNYQDYLPPCHNGTVIMTSRNTDCKTYKTLEHKALEGLDLVSAQDLLLKAGQFPSDQHDDYREDAQTVATMLASHPLALIQAGSYVAGGHCTLRGYPEVYRRQFQRLMKYNLDQAMSRYHHVYATFEASADILEKSEKEAARDALEVLSVFSMLAPNFLPLMLFNLAWTKSQDLLEVSDDDSDAGHLSRWHVQRLIPAIDPTAKQWDQYRVVEAFRLLQSLSLVTEDSNDSTKSFSMHPLVHAWAKDRQQDREIQSWLATGSLIVLSTGFEFWRANERKLQPHLHALVRKRPASVFSAAPELMIVRILLQCGWSLVGARDDPFLEDLIKDLMNELNIGLGNVDHQWLPLYRLAGFNLLNLGKASEAVRLLQQIVHIQEAVLVEEHPDLLASQHILALTYGVNGQIEEALHLLRHLVKVHERTLAEEHPHLLASQHALAKAYRENGQTEEALYLLRHVVNVRERTLTEEHPDLLYPQHELAIAYRDDRQTAKALSLLQHIVKVQERTLTEEHPGRLVSQQALALTLWDDGQLGKAIDLMEYVVKISRKALRPGHPHRETYEGNLLWMRNRLTSSSATSASSD